MYTLILNVKILLIIILFISCEKKINFTEDGCNGTWVSTNTINGEWELYKQKYSNFHWDD